MNVNNAREIGLNPDGMEVDASHFGKPSASPKEVPVRSRTSFIVLMIMLSSTSALAAQGRGVGKPSKATTATTQGTGKAAHAPKGVTQSSVKKPASVNAAAHTTKGPKTTTIAANTKVKGAATNGSGAAASKKTTTTTNKRSTTSSTSTASIPSTTTTVTTTTPTTQSVKNPKLDARLQKLLPAGTNVQDAAAGFKNWGQFVAATHVSQNLGISFAELKAQMTGSYLDPTTGLPVSTGIAPKSLGQSIQSVKAGVTVIPQTVGTGTTPTGTTTTSTAKLTISTSTTSTAVVQSEVKRAEAQAAEDFRASR